MIHAQLIEWPGVDEPEREFAALRHRQLELARQGKVEESARVAEEARRLEERLRAERN